MPIEVLEIAAAETHELRRAVLREGRADAVVVFEGDELDDTFHLGVRDDGELVGVSTWLRRAYPDRPGDDAFQLRGMATVAGRQGGGIGATMLRDGCAHCAASGAVLVWARARDTALGFYTRHGFEVVGLGYVDLTTGLPHHDIVRVL